MRTIFYFLAGEPGDVVQFAEYVGKNIQLYKMINGIELSPYACANFTRHEMATSLRSRNSFLANLVVGGYSTNERDQERAQLYSIDYMGAMVSANVVAHGFWVLVIVYGKKI
jgi:20S proteasome subunit beta 4